MKSLYLLPKNLISLILGSLAHVSWPGPLNRWLMRTFANYYKLRLDEAEKSLFDYKSIGDLFVRHLKPGVRPLGKDWAVNPADSKLTQMGRIKVGQVIYAKDKAYALSDFLADKHAHEKYASGQFFTYYLCPTDYHRVHSPVAGKITKITHIPGALWPVNDWAVANIGNLFVVNERVVVEITTDRGPVAAVFVGATNVGSIEIFKESSLQTNAFMQSSKVRHFQYPQGMSIEKGEELGQFRMGSTVVMIYPQVISGALELPREVKVRANIF